MERKGSRCGVDRGAGGQTTNRTGVAGSGWRIGGRVVTRTGAGEETASWVASPLEMGSQGQLQF
jgi:hypothetical protein